MEIIRTIKQLKEELKDLNDNDIVVIETIDDNGDVVDLFNFHLDIIDGIELLSGEVVNEIRFCQEPNKPTIKNLNATALLDTPEKVSKFNEAVKLLNEIGMDGETSEFLLEEITMHEQVTKQILNKKS